MQNINSLRQDSSHSMPMSITFVCRPIFDGITHEVLDWSFTTSFTPKGVKGVMIVGRGSLAGILTFQELISRSTSAPSESEVINLQTAVEGLGERLAASLLSFVPHAFPKGNHGGVKS